VNAVRREGYGWVACWRKTHVVTSMLDPPISDGGSHCPTWRLHTADNHARTSDCLLVECSDVWWNDMTTAAVNLNDADRSISQFLTLFLWLCIPVRCMWAVLNKQVTVLMPHLNLKTGVNCAIHGISIAKVTIDRTSCRHHAMTAVDALVAWRHVFSTPVTRRHTVRFYCQHCWQPAA